VKSESRRQSLPLACAAALILGAMSAATLALAAPPPAVRLVPVTDVPLAVMTLVGEGSVRPVLLYDARDPGVVEHYLDGRRGRIECVLRPDQSDSLGPLLAERTGKPCAEVGDLVARARTLWPNATAGIVTAAGDYEWLLRAAAFAGATGAALVVLEDDAALTRERLGDWGVKTLYVTPPVVARPELETLGRTVEGVPNAQDLTRRLLAMAPEPPALVVVTNPADRLGRFSPSSLSLLAPLVATMHRAPLVLAKSAEPAAVELQVRRFVGRHGLEPTHVALVGDELALRSHRVPDPVLEAGGPEALGGGREVRVELFSQIQEWKPQDLAVGRLVAEDASQASAVLARQLHDRATPRRPVVFLSNADEVFALGETISRTTTHELKNAGVPLRAYFREQVTPQVIRRALADTDVLVWEGHARDLTLEERGGVAADRTPAVVVLQGCYTLDRSDPFILMERGTRAIVATSAAIYSSSGSAFARALFDSLVYDGADLGTAVRNARNMLLALTLLKRARGHADWTKTYRAALAFALWGDPTTRPALEKRKTGRTPVRWRLGDGTLSLSIPQGRLPRVDVGRYRAAPAPRAMLSGLILKDGERPERWVKDLYFTVQQTSRAASHVCPIGDWNVVSLHAPQTGTLTVLVRSAWDHVDKGEPATEVRFRLVEDAAQCEPRASEGPTPAGSVPPEAGVPDHEPSETPSTTVTPAGDGTGAGHETGT
jgi:hypothetical protein